jgi:hypothetical protein
VETDAIWGLGTHGRLIALVFAFIEWAFVGLYVYSLKRFDANGLVKFMAAALALLGSSGRGDCRP